MSAALLLFRYWREGVIVAALVFGVAMCRDRDAMLVAKGRAEAAAAQRAAQLHAADSTIAVRAAEHRRDSLQLAAAEAARDASARAARAAIARWDSAVARLAARDPQLSSAADSGSAGPAGAALPAVVAAGRDLAAACSLVIRDCDIERVAAHTNAIALAGQRDAERQRGRVLEAPIPAAPRSCTGAAIGGALGGGALVEGARLLLGLVHR